MGKNVNCLECKFVAIKLEILVPENSDIEDFIQNTRYFNTKIISLSKIAPVHYSLKFRSGHDTSKSFNFKLIHSCNLNSQRSGCSKFQSRNDMDCKISHLLYKKSCEKMEIEVAEG